MHEFLDKSPAEFTKNEIIGILNLEKIQKKQVLFYKPKNELMPEICIPFYDKNGDENTAFKDVKQFVVCRFNECNTVLFNPSGSINTHYENHKAIHPRKRPFIESTGMTSSIKSFFPQKISQSEQSEITEMLAHFCLESGTSFHSATSQPMQNLLVKMNNFGARRNKILAEDFKLPHNSTVNRKAYALANQILENKKPIILDALQNIGGIALDYGFRKSDFLGATFYWFDENWTLKSALLAFSGGIIGFSVGCVL